MREPPTTHTDQAVSVSRMHPTRGRAQGLEASGDQEGIWCSFNRLPAGAVIVGEVYNPSRAIIGAG